MRILVIENYRTCPVGVVGQKLRALGAELTMLNVLQNNDSIPSNALYNYDGLVVLGGAMGAYDDQAYPQMPVVIDLILKFHRAEKPVLAICLGAQMLARALGEPFKCNGGHEIGFIPVAVTEAGQKDALFEGVTDGWSPVEWHHDNFHLPDGAELLVKGEACRNQAFRVGRASYGLQFHPEIDADILTVMVNDLDNDYLKGIGDHGQALLDQMMRELPEAIEPAVDVAEQITSRWLTICKCCSPERD